MLDLALHNAQVPIEYRHIFNSQYGLLILYLVNLDSFACAC